MGVAELLELIPMLDAIKVSQPYIGPTAKTYEPATAQNSARKM